MSKDWWPAPLAHIPAEDPWREDNVIIAEVASDKLPYPGERTMFGALVPIDQFDAVNAALANLDHYVSTDGPLPCYREDRPFNPNFWIAAKDLPADMYEPLVLSWSSHDTTVLQPDPRFLMTYGLVPRAINDGIVYWDDPRAPRREIVTVTAPFIRDFSGGTRTRAYVAISKDYLQDYLTLRHMALVQVFWETRRGQIDPEIEQRLNGRESVNIDFPDRRISLRRMTGRDECAFQVWGARHLAKPGALPITADPLDDEGLVWPGIRTPVTNIVARRLKSGDYVYVDDSVLASYEGRQEFRIHPPTGSVSHGNRWSVSYCDRVGRNLIRLEPRKLYECAPPAVVRHWNKFAVEPLRLDAYPERSTSGTLRSARRTSHMGWLGSAKRYRNSRCHSVSKSDQKSS